MTGTVVYKTPRTTAKGYTLPYSEVTSELDPNTGLPLIKSGINVRTVIPEQFKTAIAHCRSAAANNAVVTIYTVPDGKYYLLTSATMHIAAQAGATYSEECGLYIGTNQLLGARCIANTSSACNMNMSSIYVVAPNTDIEIDCGSTNAYATGSISGYIIDASEYRPLSAVTK